MHDAPYRELRFPILQVLVPRHVLHNYHFIRVNGVVAAEAEMIFIGFELPRFARANRGRDF